MNTIAYKKVLVPYDFSQGSEFALKLAERLANLSGASITLLNVIEPEMIVTGTFPHSFTNGLEATMNQMPDNEKKLRSVASASALPLKRFDIKIFIGSLHQSIVWLNEAIRHDLIIVPDLKKTITKKILPAIDVLWLMEKTKIPVIAVNHALNSFCIRNILLPVREVRGWFQKVPFTVALAKLTGAKITVLALVEDKSRYPVTAIWKKLQLCKNYLMKNYHNFEIAKTVICSEPFRAALDASGHYNIDLISVSMPEKLSLSGSDQSKHFYNKLISNGAIPVFGIVA